VERIAVIGGGSWGTALAFYLGTIGRTVALWVRRPELADEIARTRENRYYLPGFRLAETVAVSSELGRSAAGAVSIVLAVPSHTVREIVVRLRPNLEAGAVILSAAKGIENESCLLMSEVIVDELGGAARGRVAALSGPSFALEVARGDPTAAVVAAVDDALGRRFQSDFAGRNMRLYTNDDMIGTQIGGAVKNVIAIAAGIVHGLGFGSNTSAALVTRGLAEVKRLAAAAGGRAETLSGLAGLGDLVLTSTGDLSRNRTLGIALGRGERLEDVLSASRYVAEGVRTARSTLALARRLGVEMPITEQMNAVLYSSKTPQHAIRDLMERELKRES
jgi:glycerol-3-phosphate dehydrogenase (NAD(P)+)